MEPAFLFRLVSSAKKDIKMFKPRVRKIKSTARGPRRWWLMLRDLGLRPTGSFLTGVKL